MTQEEAKAKNMELIKNMIQKLSEEQGGREQLNTINEDVKEQMEQLRKNWKKEKTVREEESKKDKEEWLEERRKLEKKLEILEWKKEKKDILKASRRNVKAGGALRMEQKISGKK